MNRVAKRKPRGDLRLWKEASEHAVHFEVTDPMPAVWSLSNERPGFGQWLPPQKLPAFVPVRTFQWGEVTRSGGGRRKRCRGCSGLQRPNLRLGGRKSCLHAARVTTMSHIQRVILLVIHHSRLYAKRTSRV